MNNSNKNHPYSVRFDQETRYPGMNATQIAKAIGLKDLATLSLSIGKQRNTLDKWAIEQPVFYEALCLGVWCQIHRDQVPALLRADNALLQARVEALEAEAGRRGRTRGTQI